MESPQGIGHDWSFDERNGEWKCSKCSFDVYDPSNYTLGPPRRDMKFIPWGATEYLSCEEIQAWIVQKE